MNIRIKYFLADTAKSLYSLVALAILITVLAQPAEVRGAEYGLSPQSDVFEQYFIDKDTTVQSNTYLGAYFRIQEKLPADKILRQVLRQGVLARKIMSSVAVEGEEKLFHQELKKELAVYPDKVVEVVMTAYTSTPDQTDDSPFIAASGKHVYDGMLAANWLPLGTKVKIPELYGDKIFTVDDRMNSRYGYGRMDIWLDATKAEARKFGVKRLTVEVYYQDKTEKKVEKLVLAR